MPITKSAIKKARQDVKAREHNRDIRDAYKKASKEVRKAVLGGNIKEATELLKKAYSEIDKAAKRNVIHKNNASRRKSRLSSLLKTNSTKTKEASK